MIVSWGNAYFIFRRHRRAYTHMVVYCIESKGINIVHSIVLEILDNGKKNNKVFFIDRRGYRSNQISRRVSCWRDSKRVCSRCVYHLKKIIKVQLTYFYGLLDRLANAISLSSLLSDKYPVLLFSILFHFILFLLPF